MWCSQMAPTASTFTGIQARSIMAPLATRSFSTSTNEGPRKTLEQATTWDGLNHFIDDPAAMPAGRSWKAVELRRKSFDDLHKLWFVLVRERNMLHSQKLVAKRNGIVMNEFGRVKKVNESMGRIRRVLNERRLIRQHDERVSYDIADMENSADQDMDILPESSTPLTYVDELRMKKEIHGEERHMMHKAAQRRKGAFQKGQRGHGIYGGTDRKTKQKKRQSQKYSRLDTLLSDN